MLEPPRYFPMQAWSEIAGTLEPAREKPIDEAVLCAVTCYRAAGHPLPNLLTKNGCVKCGPANGAMQRVVKFIGRETAEDRVGARHCGTALAQDILSTFMVWHGKDELAWVLEAYLLSYQRNLEPDDDDNDDDELLAAADKLVERFFGCPAGSVHLGSFRPVHIEH